MAKTIRVSAFSTSSNEALIIPEEALVIPGYEPYKIPKNWCWTYWGHCGSFIAGSAFKEKFQGNKNLNIPFYKVGSLKYSNNSGCLYDNDNTIDEEIRKNIKATLIPEKSIIFAKIGEAIKLNRRSLNPSPCCIDNNLMAFIPNNKCYYKYVFYWSKSIDLYAFANATTVPAIRKTDLEEIPFPLAPYNKQIEIVEHIELLFSKLDEAKEKAQETLDAFEMRKASILHKAFTGELTTEWRKENEITGNAYSKRRFDEVAEIKSNLVDPADYPNYPHIAPDNIEKKTGVLLDYHTIEEDGVKSGKHLFYPGQILYSKIRPNLSKVVVVDFKGLCSADMYPIEAKGDAKCLWYYMLSEEFLEQASSAGSRSVLPKINQKELSRLKVSLPASIDEQREISRILDTLLERELQTKQTAEMVIDQIDIMKKSILARAFRGELGTNNPNDENAEELLKRILSEKAKEANEQPKVKRTRIVIPEEIENLLQTNLEREIIKLFYKSETKEVSAEDILSVSSKTFDVLEAIRVLENKKIIKKTKRNFYKIAR